MLGAAGRSRPQASCRLVDGHLSRGGWARIGRRTRKARGYRAGPAMNVVRDTGIEPVTSSVSGKRSPAELIARVETVPWRWRRESNPCARLCRPLPHHSATPPLGLMPQSHLRADDGIRTRDPHLGKVMRYQLRYIRAPRARSSPVAKQNISPPMRADTNPHDGRATRGQQPCFRTGDRPAAKVRIHGGFSCRDR